MKKYMIFALCAIFAISCTAKFEEMNVDPNGVTPEQMGYDGLAIGAYFAQMQAGVSTVGVDKGGRFQQVEGLEADLFSGQIACINIWSAGNHDCYSLTPSWYNVPFEDAYTEIMLPWEKIRKVCDEQNNDLALAIATIVKVYGMSRITDLYGSIPYSEFGGSTQVAYDSQEDIYDSFFDELAYSVQVLRSTCEANPSAVVLSMYDHVYGGNIAKWIKFANTLRLRLAMRISYVNETKAKSEYTAALNDYLGVMTNAGDDAKLGNSGSLTYINPLWEISESFEDQRMSANMESYLVGYNDPRLQVYFRANSNGEYKGMRNGVTNIVKANCTPVISGLNFESSSPMWWMESSEAYFLQAEAAYRWGMGDAQALYEAGVRASFASKGAQGVDAYLAGDTAPVDYVAPANTRSNNISAPTTTTVSWNGTGDKLEKIMIQKWIALYPNGPEAWSEIRRSGFPKIFAPQTLSSSEVPSGQVISRLKYPTSEYSNNSENVQAAVNAAFGGNDSAGARLWWDVHR